MFWKRDGNGSSFGRWPTYSDRVTTDTNGRKRGTKHHPSAPILPGGPVGNTSRLTHGLYSRRRLPLSRPELDEIEALLEMPHVIPPDCLAAEEIVRLRSLIKRIDRHLTDNQVENGMGEARRIIEYRRKLSGELRAWLQDFGMTPKSRADFAQAMAGAGLADQLRRIREQEELGA